jgi:hypothetical protein
MKVEGEKALAGKAFSSNSRSDFGVVSPKFVQETTADPSTHHPQTEKRLGPRSLRMTAFVLL